MNNSQIIIMGVIQSLLFIISAISKSECDTIKFNTKKACFQSNYWLDKKDLLKRNKLFKYALSFI